MRAARTLLAAAAIAVGGVGLGACASNGAATGTPSGTTSKTTAGSGTRSATGGTRSTSTTGTPGTSTSSASSTSTSTSPSTTSTTAAPPTTAGTPGCEVAGLHVALAGSQGAAGTVELTFSLTSTSATACEMVGYPGLVLVTTSGAGLPTTVVHGGTLFFEAISPTSVDLAPGRTAYFNVGFSDVQSGAAACTDAHDVAVTPPSGSAAATVPVPSGIHACDGGTLHVSAVFSSTDTAAMQTIAS